MSRIMVTCSTCQGTGKIIGMNPKTQEAKEVTCSTCNGSGKVSNSQFPA